MSLSEVKQKHNLAEIRVWKEYKRRKDEAVWTETQKWEYYAADILAWIATKVTGKAKQAKQFLRKFEIQDETRYEIKEVTEFGTKIIKVDEDKRKQNLATKKLMYMSLFQKSNQQLKPPKEK